MIGFWPALIIAILAGLVLLGLLPGTQVVWIIVLILALLGGVIHSYPYWSRRVP